MGEIISSLISALFLSIPNSDSFLFEKGKIVAIGLLRFVMIIDDFDLFKLDNISKQCALNWLIAIFWLIFTIYTCLTITIIVWSIIIVKQTNYIKIISLLYQYSIILIQNIVAYYKIILKQQVRTLVMLV